MTHCCPHCGLKPDLAYDEISIVEHDNLLVCRGQSVRIPHAKTLIVKLMLKAGKKGITAKKIADDIYAESFYTRLIEERTVHVHISQLRRIMSEAKMPFTILDNRRSYKATYRIALIDETPERELPPRYKKRSHVREHVAELMT